MFSTIIQNFWGMFLFFIFVVLPIIFLFGVMQKVTETSREDGKKAEKKIKDIAPIKEETASYKAPSEFYRTVKKEAGSYVVVGPDNMEAIVLKVDAHDGAKYWIAILPLKEAKKSERVKTKKEAVALAIELLKEHKESKNGS